MFTRTFKVVTGLILSASVLGGVIIPEIVAPPSAEATTTNGVLSSKQNLTVKLVGVRLNDTSNTQFRKMNLATTRNIVNKEADSYWGSMTKNRTNISVSSTTTFTSRSASSKQPYEKRLESVKADMKYKQKPNEVLLLVFPVDGRGHAYRHDDGSGRMYLGLSYSTNKSIIVHEFGHILGLRHANGIICKNGARDPYYNRSTKSFTTRGCSIADYGDALDIMGTTRNAHGRTPVVSAAQWDSVGFGNGREIRSVGSRMSPGKSYTYRIYPWAGNANHRALKFTDSRTKEVYYIELRTPVGYDSKKATGGYQGVKITKDNPARKHGSIMIRPNTKTDSRTDPRPTWKSGMTFTTRGGAKVKINQVSKTSASVTITAAR